MACPIIKQCKAASGIDCTDRNHEECDFYLNLLECRKRKEHQSLKTQIALPEMVIM